MKASDLTKVQTLLNRLTRVRRDLERLAAVPAAPQEASVSLTYYSQEDERNYTPEFELEGSEGAPLREQVQQLLRGRELGLVRQLSVLGVQADV